MSGKVVRVREVLNLREFSKIQLGKWTREDVLREFGRPAQIDRTGDWSGDILAYRWRENVNSRWFWIYIDGQGRVGRTQQGDEYPVFHDDN